MKEILGILLGFTLPVMSVCALVGMLYYLSHSFWSLLPLLIIVGISYSNESDNGRKI